MMKIENANDIAGVPVASDTFSEAVFPVASEIHLDPSKYLPEIAEFDMSERQKVELLETVWAIMQRFVDLGFDGGLAENIGGQVADEFNAVATLDLVDVKYAETVRVKGAGQVKPAGKEGPT